MVKTFTLTVGSCLLLNAVYAQIPANDRPCGAVSVTPGGCFDGSTTGSLDDTNGQGIGADCQSHGNNVDVWYTFIANNTGFNFQVYHDTTIGGTTYTASSVDVLLFRPSIYSPCVPTLPCSDPSACQVPDLVGLACWEDDGSRVLDGAISSGLVVGQRYYFLVSSAVVSGETPGTFRVCFSNTPYTPPGRNCDEASTICSRTNFTANGGDYTILRENLDASSCLGVHYDGAGGASTYNMPSRWYELTFATSGTFGFTAMPNPSSGDLDFAVYNTAMTPCSTSMGTPVGCNFSACAGITGISSTLTNDCSGPAINYNAIGDDCNVVTITPNPANCSGTPSLFNAGGGNSALPSGLFNVSAGQTYTVYIGNYANSSANGFTFNFAPNMTALVGPQSGFTLSNVTCNLGTMTVDLSANIVTPGFVYTWEFGDGSYATGSTTSHTYSTDNPMVARLTVQDTNSTQECLASTELELSCPLPEVFSSVEARPNDAGTPEIRWSTPLGLPVSRFEVMYSTDLQNWLVADKVFKDKAVAGSVMRYTYLHEQAPQGDVHYKVLHYDEAGMQTASSLVLVKANRVQERHLLMIHDATGREISQPLPGQVLFYRYDDGSTEKRIIIR